MTALLEDSVVSAKAALPGLSIKDRLLKNLVPKFVTLLLVLACWLLINARQGGVQAVTAQVKFHDMPENLALKNDLPFELEVQLKVLSTIFTSSKKLEIVADIDLSKVHEGINNIPVEGKAFQLPLGVSVIKVAPSVLKIVAERKMHRDLPVYLRKTGRLPKGVRLRSLAIEPARVRVMGSESSLAQLSQVYTEPLDIGEVTRSQVIEVKILPPSPQVQLGSVDTVKAKIVVSR